jgi:hypothetical protein
MERDWRVMLAMATLIALAIVVAFVLMDLARSDPQAGHTTVDGGLQSVADISTGAIAPLGNTAQLQTSVGQSGLVPNSYDGPGGGPAASGILEGTIEPGRALSVWIPTANASVPVSMGSFAPVITGGEDIPGNDLTGLALGSSAAVNQTGQEWLGVTTYSQLALLAASTVVAAMVAGKTCICSWGMSKRVTVPLLRPMTA